MENMSYQVVLAWRPLGVSDERAFPRSRGLATRSPIVVGASVVALMTNHSAALNISLSHDLAGGRMRKSCPYHMA